MRSYVLSNPSASVSPRGTKLTRASANGLPLNTTRTLIGVPGPIGTTGLASGTSSSAWPSGLAKPAQSVRTLSRLGLAEEIGLRTADHAHRLAVIDNPVRRVRHDVNARLGRSEFRRIEAFLGRIAQVGEARLQIDGFAVGANDIERAARRVELGGQLEIAMIVAVIAEHEVDMDGIADAYQIRIGLHPRVVSLARRRREHDAKEYEENCA